MKRSILILCVTLLLVMASTTVWSSRSDFSDIEVSQGNFFATGEWEWYTPTPSPTPTEPPRPSLALDPNDGEVQTCSNIVTHIISVSNTADEPKDLALNVTLGVSIVKGDTYVDHIDYEPLIGDIPAGEARDFSMEIHLNDLWTAASSGEEVKLLIEVTGEDNWPEQNVGRQAHLTIVKCASSPSVEVTSPTGGEVFYIAQKATIKWEATSACDLPLTVDIDFDANSGNGGYPYHIATIEQNQQGENTYDWLIPWGNPYLISEHCRIRITAANPCGLSAQAESGDFCPHLPPPPEVVATSPNGGENWLLGEMHPITWAANGISPEIMAVDIHLSPDGGVSWVQIAANEENDGIFDWAIPADAPVSDKAIIKIIATYPFGVSGQDSSDNGFSLGEPAPTLEPTPSPPMPSLSLEPADAQIETRSNSVTYVISVSNSAGEPEDLARNVTFCVSVTEGDEYVRRINYQPMVGDIPAGEARDFSMEIQLNSRWTKAKVGTEVTLLIEVTGEDNWPENNIGKAAHLTIIRKKG